MILIFGGAFQGKEEYALNEYGLREKDIYHCSMDTMVIDFDRKIISNLDQFVLACVKADINPNECLEENIERFRDKIVITDDISQGIVPMDKIERAWREDTGRCMTYLGSEADSVIRVFCGLGNKIK